MRSTFRSASFGLSLLLMAGAMAQAPYALVISGQLEGCSPGQMVTIQTMPGTLPSQSVTVTLDNCLFGTIFYMDSPTGGVLAYSTCGNGTVTADSSSYSITDPSDSGAVVLALACGGDTSTACQACITVTQSSVSGTAVPFSAQISSCTTGGTPPYTNSWLLPDGSISLDQSPTFLFNGPGAYGVCLLSSDATGCTSAACDTVYVGADGTINPTNTQDCQAGFWVVQAYSDTSSGGGMLAPVPNEVWVWNLSTGNNGTSQYAWDFGDGNSSAEAYPTHVYDGDGPYVLCLTITNGSCSDSYCDSISVDDNGLLNGMLINGHPADQNHRSGGFTLNVLAELPTGVQELPTIAELKLWPNPAQDELNISLNNSRAGLVPVTVIDLTGRTVISEDRNMALGVNTLRLNTSDLQPGLYMVRIGNDAHSVAHRFMKLR
jgi:PKD repeat protein